MTVKDLYELTARLMRDRKDDLQVCFADSPFAQITIPINNYKEMELVGKNVIVLLFVSHNLQGQIEGK